MSRTKKVVMVIVEGSSEEEALYPALKKIGSHLNITFDVVHTDLLTSYNHDANIKNAVGNRVSELKKKRKFRTDDFLLVAHLVDTDGVFVSEDQIRIDESCTEISYSDDCIQVRDEEHRIQVLKRNTIKSEKIKQLITQTKTAGVPYFVYYFSCNLDHVIHNIQSLSQREKTNKARNFSEQHEGNISSFIDFFANDSFHVAGEYKETWSFIQEQNRSLRRFTNFFLLLEKISEKDQAE